MAIESIDVIVKSIEKINPNAKYAIRDRDINNIEWLENTTPIPVADIQAEMPAIEFDFSMKDLRAKRNNLLKETDHYALSDQTLSDDMRTYRQDLRDITEGLTTVEDVDSVTWPTKPGA